MKTFYCQRCFGIKHQQKQQHQSIPVDYTQMTNTQLINSILEFEKIHLPSTADVQPNVFPFRDQDSTQWKRRDFSEISYLLPKEMLFNKIVPFVCDYL
jgi:hypothetical protein